MRKRLLAQFRPSAIAPLIFALAVIGLGDAANAANYSLSGLARDQRGSIQLPLPPSLFAGARGIAAHGTAMQTGTAVPGGGPATITFPPGALLDLPIGVGGFLIPVPDVIQLRTTFSHAGPRTILGMDTTTTLMAGRTGPSNFAFCPGAAANPTCTTVAAGGTQGTVNGIIKYTAGPNKFGGTFQLLLKGTGRQTNKGAALPATVMTVMGGTKAALPFSAINIKLGGTALIPGGLVYSFMTTNLLGPSPRTHPYGYMTTPMGLLSPGPVVGTGYSISNQQTVFPMTTGVVYGYVQFGAQGFPPPSKITSSGYDKRTAGGAGRIQLIGSSLSRTFPTGGVDPPEGSVVNRLKMTFNFTPQPALPLSSPAMLMTLGTLVMLSAGFAVARRR